LESARFAARELWRNAAARLQTKRRTGWFIAVSRQPELFYSRQGRFSSEGLADLPLPAGTAKMADPFVITHEGRNWLFYEDIPVGSRRGRLCGMELGTRDARPFVILDKPYHLSWPCIFRHHGDFFLIPESADDGTVQLYRATRFPFEFQLETVLVRDVALLDTTPYFLDGRWYFFSTTPPPFMETHLFIADSLDSPWRLHPCSPISGSVTSSRSAGHLFRHNGRLLRPTQDCSIRYGYGMTINEVTRLTPTEFVEHRAGYIAPDWRRNLLGTHTLNSDAAFEVVDGIRYQE
jgi:hypothetical protein